MTSSRRDARLLFLIGLAFAAGVAAACAISFHVFNEPLLQDNPLAAMAITCAAAALIIWIWAALKLTHDWRARYLAFSRRRLALHAFLAVAVMILSHLALLWVIIDERVAAIDRLRAQGILYLRDPDLAHGGLCLADCRPTPTFQALYVNGAFALNTVEMRRDRNRYDSNIAICATSHSHAEFLTWYHWNSVERAAAKSAAFAARCGWTREALRNEYDNARVEAARLDKQSPQNISDVLKQLSVFPGIEVRPFPNNELESLRYLRRYTLDDYRILEKQGPRLRTEGTRMWLRWPASRLSLFDPERNLIAVCEWDSGLGYNRPHIVNLSQLWMVLLALFAAWAVIFTPLCYVRMGDTKLLALVAAGFLLLAIIGFTVWTSLRLSPQFSSHNLDAVHVLAVVALIASGVATALAAWKWGASR